MAKFRKRPVVIEAVQYKSNNFDAICDFIGTTPIPKHNPDFGVDENGNTNEPYLGIYIGTLEGNMLASIGDWIIKGVNGEFYPCKPDIFAKTYEAVDNKLTRFPFGVALEELKLGKVIFREGWNGKGLYIVKQIPSIIGGDIITNMQSLPQSAKDLLMNNTKEIKYLNQMLIININTGEANSWVPSSSDLFAEDWALLV